jgi:hypothetical protein
MAFTLTRPVFFAAASAAALSAVGMFRYNAARLRANDARQQSSSPYVTVDRSGGGI